MHHTLTPFLRYFKDSCFERLDNAIMAATDAKLWVILAARCEYAAGQDYLTDPMANVFHNATLRMMLYTAWQYVARRYRSWDYIAAYEVMAEPRDKLANASVVRGFYSGACDAVREVDPDTACMVGAGPYYKIWRFTGDVVLPNNDNVIYTFDYFIPDSWAFGEPAIPSYEPNTCDIRTATVS